MNPLMWSMECFDVVNGIFSMWYLICRNAFVQYINACTHTPSLPRRWKQLNNQLTMPIQTTRRASATWRKPDNCGSGRWKYYAGYVPLGLIGYIFTDDYNILLAIPRAGGAENSVHSPSNVDLLQHVVQDHGRC